MDKLAISIYRQPKWVWEDLVRMSGPRNGNYASTYGWSINGYGSVSGNNRSLGARLIRNDQTLEEGTAWTDLSINSQYLQFNNLTQDGDKVQIKYDTTRILRFWYRYAGISEILFPINQALNLKEISLRRNNIAFGDFNLSNLSQLEIFEISNNISIDSLILHPDAPINLYYLDNTSVPQPVMDYIIIHAYNKGLSNGNILNRNIMPSDDVCEEVDALLNRGWSITTVPECTTVELAWRPIEPYCIQPPEIGVLSVIDETISTITLEWTPATDNIGITEYIVYYYNYSNPDVVMTKTIPGNTTTTTMYDLDIATYGFTIIGKNFDGLFTDESNFVQGSTLPTVSPKPDEGEVPNEDKPTFELNGAWSFEDSGALRVNHNGKNREYTSNNLPDGSLWSVTNGGYGLRIDWEDSENCGGKNKYTQSGTAQIEITANVEEKIYINWRGMAEMQDTGYENMYIEIDGVKIGEATSPGGQLGCEMGKIESTNYFPDGYTLTPGVHTVYISSTTADPLYHTNSYYEFAFSLNPIDTF